MITFATGCSGIGAPEVAWHDRLGWKCLWCSEIEAFPSAVLKYHWPDVPNVGDFLTIAERLDQDELEAPDVFIAGTPCQAFSMAGLRNSLKDERGGLTLEYCRIANAMDEQRRRKKLNPTIFVWENVLGVLSTEDNAFGCLLSGMLGLDSPVVPTDGRWGYYGSLIGKRAVGWRTLDAKYFRVAQRRRRVFVVATARPGFSPARGLFEFGSVPKSFEEVRSARQRLADGIKIHSRKSVTIRMRAGCEGGGKGALIGEEISNTIQTENDQTLIHYNGELEEICVPVNSMILGKNVKIQDRQTTGIGFNGEPLPTLQAKHHHAVIYSHWDNPVNPHPPLGAIGKGVGFSNQEVFAQRGAMLVLDESKGLYGVARRITTVECARLQGFPDHHTEIPWHGKPANECPTDHQFKAYGNSMCCNVIEWIGKQIEKEIMNPQPINIYQPNQMEFEF